jgi:hypothetical protein
MFNYSASVKIKHQTFKCEVWYLSHFTGRWHCVLWNTKEHKKPWAVKAHCYSTHTGFIRWTLTCPWEEPLVVTPQYWASETGSLWPAKPVPYTWVREQQCKINNNTTLWNDSKHSIPAGQFNSPGQGCTAEAFTSPHLPKSELVSLQGRTRNPAEHQSTVPPEWPERKWRSASRVSNKKIGTRSNHLWTTRGTTIVKRILDVLPIQLPATRNRHHTPQTLFEISNNIHSFLQDGYIHLGWVCSGAC